MIRTSFLSDINGTISESKYFNINDFSIETAKINEKSEYLLKITYRFSAKYYLFAWIPNQKSKDKDGYSDDFKVQLRTAPGEISEIEEKRASGKAALLGEIKFWVNRIEEDLKTVPLSRLILENKESLENLIEQFENMDDSYFTVEESEKFKLRLDELEERLANNIRENISDKKEQDAKISELENEINTLKQKIDSHSKKAWAGVFVSKSLDWLKNPLNRKILISGAEVAQSILSDGLEKGEQIIHSAEKMINQ